MIGRFLNATVVVLVAGAIAGGSAAAQASPAPEAGLPEVIWQLSVATLADGSSIIPDDPARYTIQFLPDGELRLRVDCNLGWGSYAVAGSALTIERIATTRIGCPPDSIGDEFAGWLSAVASFAFEDEALVLTLRDDAGSLRFMPALTGVVWEWQRFLGGNDAELVPDDPTRYTLEFVPDGTVAVRADCNSGQGAYAADPPQLDLTGIATTEVACPPGSLGDRFVSDLEEVVSYVFRQGHLSLALPLDAGFLLFAARSVPDEATPTAAG